MPVAAYNPACPLLLYNSFDLATSYSCQIKSSIAKKGRITRKTIRTLNNGVDAVLHSPE